MRRVLPTVVVAVATAAAAAGLVIGPVLAGSRNGGSAAPVPVSGSFLAEVPPTTAGIRFFERRVEARPADAVSWTALGELYHQLGRETGADAPFAVGEEALREAVRLSPGYSRARAALAATLTSRHRFEEAIAIATDLLDADPDRAGVLATRGDALISIGRYAESAADYQRLHLLDPGTESFARLAHVAELNGDPEGALELVDQAVSAVHGTTGEAAAWAYYRQGDLNRHLGRWEQARRSFDESLRRFDEFPLALEGLFDVAIKTGDLDEGERLLARLAAAGSSVTTRLLGADLAALQGDVAAAGDLVSESILELEQLDPVLAGRDLAILLADAGLRRAEAVRLAEADLALRPDVFAFDAVAWARFRAGDVDRAREAIDRALALGTKEPSFLHHSALIALAEGDDERARRDLTAALDINPDFDPFDAPAALELLAGLRSN